MTDLLEAPLMGPPAPREPEQQQIADTSLGEVQAFYDQPPIALANGRYQCPLPSCFYEAATAQAIGPHKAAHARRHGLLKPTGGGNRKAQPDAPRKVADPRVDCPQCGKSITRGHIKGHLRTVHHLTEYQAHQAAEVVLAATRANPAPVPDPGPQHQLATQLKPRGERRDITVMDAAVAVLMGTTGKDSIKLHDLPEVMAWVLHTQQVVQLVNES